MSTHTFFANTISGEIQTLSDWTSDAKALGEDVEQWISTGQLLPVELEDDDEFFLTNRVFPGWFGDAKEGEEYWSEWAGHAVDKDGNNYKIVYQFAAVRGQEPEDDGSWPWEDESKIYRVEVL